MGTTHYAAHFAQRTTPVVDAPAPEGGQAPNLSAVETPTHDWALDGPADHSCVFCPRCLDHVQEPRHAQPFHEHGPLDVNVFSTGAVISLGETDLNPDEAERLAQSILRAVKVARALRGRQ